MPMPRKVLENFSVEWLQVMDETGKVDAKLMPGLTPADMLKMHEMMVTTRLLDDKMFKLQRQGRMGTFGQSLGQEACQIGSACALSDDDMVFPAFREHGVYIAKKFPMSQYAQYWGGDERGAHIPNGINIFTVAIPVATQIPHAVGYAWAMKMKKKKAIAVTYFGDGGSSRGDFHEGMNFAGTFKLPCVFICQNNQWAISVPVSKQTAAKTIAQKAIAYGFKGIRVDGNDIFAVYAAMKEAVESARKGGGPTLIECLTYRMADHTTSDDAKRYRSQEEVAEWQKKDPLARLEKYMFANKIMDDAKKKQVWGAATARVEDAIKEYEQIKGPDPEDMFKFVYAEMTQELREQMEEMKSNEGAAQATPAKSTAKDEKDIGYAL